VTNARRRPVREHHHVVVVEVRQPIERHAAQVGTLALEQPVTAVAVHETRLDEASIAQAGGGDVGRHRLGRAVGEAVDVLDEAREVQGHGAGAADLAAARGLETRDAARFHRQVRDGDIDPFVDDRFADHADAQPRRPGQEPLQLLEREPERRQIAEEHAVVRQQRIDLGRFGRGQQEVRELGGRERRAVREVEAAAVPLDQRLLAEDVRRLVEHEIGVLGALHVDVWAQPFDRRDRRRFVDDGDVVHDFQGGKLTRPILLAERDGAFLGDVAVGGDGDHEDVAERSRILEMNQVPHVDEVEGAVAQHDRSVRELLAQRGQPLQREDLVGGAERSSRPANHRPAALATPPSDVGALHRSAQRTPSVRATSTKFFSRNAWLSPRVRSVRSMATSR